VDKAVVEVYANDRQAIGRRVYPAEAESVGLVLFTEGGPATFTKIKGWEISPSNPF
jgi:beta-fructofuranosidase